VRKTAAIDSICARSRKHPSPHEKRGDGFRLRLSRVCEADARLADDSPAYHRQPPCRRKLTCPLNVFVIWQPTCVRRFLSHVDRPIAAVRASEQIPDEIRRVMHRAGIDFAGRSQAKGEVMAIELGDSGI
jgi:hypothetical protein